MSARKQTSVSPKLVHHIRSHLCNLQLLHANYQISLSEKHKKLRRIIESLPEQSERENDTDNINNHLNDLLDEITEYLSRTVGEIEDGMKDYFEEIQRTDSCMPRVCIKGFENEKIVDVYRGDIPYKDDSVVVRDNTAFHTIREGIDKGYYHEPNIPRAVKPRNRGYENKRLDLKRAAAYKTLTVAQVNALAEDAYFDKDWNDCWHEVKMPDGSIKTLEQSAYYKSTLVIPLTLRRVMSLRPPDKILTETSNKLFGKGNQADASKLLYGFLCFDHVKPNFFNDDIDVDIGWIYADAASHAFISVNLLTELSDTYDKTMKYLAMHPAGSSIGKDGDSADESTDKSKRIKRGLLAE